MQVNSDFVKRLEEFCLDYRIPKKFHGSLRLVADMAFVLGLQIEPRVLQPRKEQETLQETEQ